MLPNSSSFGETPGLAPSRRFGYRLRLRNSVCRKEAIVRELLDYAGPAGAFVALTAALLFVAGIVLLALSRTTRVFAVYFVLIWMPLLIGTLGTRAAMDEMDHSPLTYSDSISPRALKKVRSQLRRPLNMGIAATAALLPIAVVGLVVFRRREEKPEQEDASSRIQ
jgi:predicted secreted protein